MATKSSNPIFNQCSLYFVLWCLYLLQGTLYKTGGKLSVSLLAIILFMSLIHSVVIIQWRHKPALFVGLEALLVMFFLYGIGLMITDGAYTKGISMHPPTYNYLKNLLISLLPIISCYYFSKKGLLTQQSLRYWIPIFLIIALLQYFNYQRNALEVLISDREDITNNSGYILLSLIPCMYVYRNRYLQVAGVAVCVLFVMLSMKRGAMLILGATIILYVFQQMRGMRIGRRILFIALMAGVGLLLYNYLDETLFQNDYFNTRLEKTLEGDSSGRDNIYKNLWTKYTSFNVTEKIIGIGADGTLKVSRNYAHNDWLEILINQGIIGITIYFLYWICFFRTIRDRRLPRASRDVLIMVFLVMFMKSLFSMSVNDNTIYLSSIFGLTLAGGLFADDSQSSSYRQSSVIA